MNTPPKVDSVGIAVTGDVKQVYGVISLSRQVLSDTLSSPHETVLIQAKTDCGRTISILKQGKEKPTFEVSVSKPGSEEEERSYRGPEGSDAARVFFGYESRCKKEVL